MAASTSFGDQMQELKRKISSLEWDIPLLKNNELKAMREKELLALKKKFAELQDMHKSEVIEI